MSVVLIFVDGVGLSPSGPYNPLSGPEGRLGGLLPEPGLTLDLFGNFAEKEWNLEGGRDGQVPAVAVQLDACLGVDGLPQSATGQTTLFTGKNAPQVLGRHLSGFPTPTLLGLLAEFSLFRRARELGLSATFANSFPAGYMEAIATGRRRHATTTAAILAGGYPLRTWTQLKRGEALCHDLTGAAMEKRGYPVPLTTPEGAAERLLAMAGSHDVVLFEYFMTDRAGHSGNFEEARRCFADLARFTGSLLAGLDFRRDTLVLVSDHGNVEDLSVQTHTRNPVPAVAAGAQAHCLRGARSLMDVAPAVLRMLEAERGG